MATTFIDRGYLRPVTFDYDNIKGTGIIRLDTNKKFESAACSITETIMTEEYLLERLVYRMYTRYSEEFHPKKEYVLKFLKRQGYSDELIRKAINYLESAAKLGMGNTSDDKLYTANKDFYSLLRYGTSFKIEGKSQNQHVSYIDWDNIKNNDFYIAEEVTYVGCHEKRPDVVIYVNGIALAVFLLNHK